MKQTFLEQDYIAVKLPKLTTFICKTKKMGPYEKFFQWLAKKWAERQRIKFPMFLKRG